jgi:phenol 2-monooxygenase (NADPH)
VLVIGCGPAGLVLAAQLSEAYWVNEVAFWRPDPEEPSTITRVQRVPDTEEGLSECPHVIVNQARMLAYLRDHMKRSSSRSTPVYGLHASDIAVAARGRRARRRARAGRAPGVTEAVPGDRSQTPGRQAAPRSAR